jgi:eukaryotic-like serine/threonine-protein kinase
MSTQNPPPSHSGRSDQSDPGGAHTELVQAIFLAACDLPQEQQWAYVQERCGDDPRLLKEVISLLGFDSPSGDTFANLVLGSSFDLNLAHPADGGSPAKPTAIGPYTISGEIGVGGMGVVYRAEQQNPKREVALKVIRTGLATDEVLQRFQFEAQVLGRLQHPGIAQIFEAGTASSELGTQPFFAMELVEGLDLMEHARQQRSTVREKLATLAAICDAVHHAHQKGVIHRDLKPGNILVNSNGQPKVLDFGVARSTNADVTLTSASQSVQKIIGTLPYMSPEQVSGDAQELDIRSDVYALGVIAYELLAGHTPFDLEKRSIAEVARVIAEDEPAPLSSISRVFRGDLETIVSKATEKDMNRRYESASAFAADIRRYLNDEPILARPASAIYQLTKFSRRNKGMVGGFCLALVVLISGIVTTSMGWSAATYQEGLASEAAKVADDRADQLQQVVDFQSTQLESLNAETLGWGIRQEIFSLQEQIASRKLAGGEELAAQRRLLEQGFTGLDFTGLGLKILDRHFFSSALEATKDFDDQPLVQAQLLQTLATIMHKAGLQSEAEAPQRKALDLRRRHLGNEGEKTLQSISGLALLLQKLDQLGAAEPLFLEALKTKQGSLGNEDQSTLASMSSLGSFLHEQEKWDQASEHLHDALTAQRRILGDGHPDTLITIGNLCALLEDQGKHLDSEDLFREAVELSRQSLGEDHPDTLSSKGNLAMLLYAQGKLEEAEPMLRENLAHTRKKFGALHPQTLYAVNNFGSLLHAQGKYSEAEPFLRETLEARRVILGQEHADTLVSTSNLGMVLYSQHKLDEAESLHQKALEARRRLLGNSHSETHSSLNNLGMLYYAKADYAKAEPLLREALDGMRANLGSEHPSTLAAVNNLGMVLYSLGKPADAEPLFLEASEILRSTLGDDHPSTLLAINNLGMLFLGQGKREQAESCFLEAVNTSRSKLGSKHSSTLTFIANLALFYWDDRNASKVIPLTEEWLEHSLKNAPNFANMQKLKADAVAVRENGKK